MNFKHIHIGEMIKVLVTERGIDLPRICNFLDSTESDVFMMYSSNSIDSELLLRWSKLLEYDFFRIYSQHLILFSPSSINKNKEKQSTSLPQFRKNIYTKEIISYILEKLEKGEITKKKVLEEYNIPKTTLYKWISKYKK